MKALVVPDIHEAKNLDSLESAIARESADRVILLGDYFDQWKDGPLDAARTAEWLKRSLRQSNRTHLFGNHDVAYAFPRNPHAMCPGFTTEKLTAIRRHLTQRDWAKLRFIAWEHDFLFSHAGWSSRYVPHPATDVVALKDYLAAEERAARMALRAGQMHWFYSVGLKRGGPEPEGGILWCDVREFVATTGLNQVFGHTIGCAGVVIRHRGSFDLCLDTTTRWAGIQHYLTIEWLFGGRRVMVKTISGMVERELDLDRVQNESDPDDPNLESQ